MFSRRLRCHGVGTVVAVIVNRPVLRHTNPMSAVAVAPSVVAEKPEEQTMVINMSTLSNDVVFQYTCPGYEPAPIWSLSNTFASSLSIMSVVVVVVAEFFIRSYRSTIPPGHYRDRRLRRKAEAIIIEVIVALSIFA